MSPRRTVSISLFAVLASAVPAAASFHFAHIHRILTGLDGEANVQFVEIRMDAGGQNFVAGTKLAAFDATGAFVGIALTVPGNVAVGTNQATWIMGSTAFAAAAGITPDFTFTNGILPAESGMVCWGAPSNNGTPSQYVDCISYGDYTGPDNTHTTAPNTITPFGHGLVRTASTNNSENDYACEDPSTPRNNASQTGSIEATSSCVPAECGNAEVEDPEQCDDGDTEFVTGDYCTGDCSFTPCGVPSNSGAAPKSSDALFVLRAAVQGTHCDLSTCDVNDNGAVTAGDALAILKKAVGQSVTLTCTQLPPA
jgi:cysteine-rich repeat protein